MVIPNYVKLPSTEELKVPQELVLSQPALKAGAFHLGTFCDFESKEFMLCRREMKDPRKCLQEGATVTACGVKFFQLVKKNCKDEFNKYMHCVDCNSGGGLTLARCRQPQRVFDKCMLEKMNIERPQIGHYGRAHVHDSARPPPPPDVVRDFKAEASSMIDELPEDYPRNDEYKRYAKRGTTPFMQ